MGSLILLLIVIIISISLILTIHYIGESQTDSVLIIMLWSSQVLLILSGLLLSFGYSIYSWLKLGTWLTISPNYIASKLEETNSFRKTIQADPGWLGITQINNWYSNIHIGWTFLGIVVVIILWFIIYAYYIDRKLLKEAGIK